MASPIGFPEANKVFVKPENMTDDQCARLPACKVVPDDGPSYVLACWQLTPEEIIEVLQLGVVWIGIMGAGVPPHFIAGKKPI